MPLLSENRWRWRTLIRWDPRLDANRCPMAVHTTRCRLRLIQRSAPTVNARPCRWQALIRWDPRLDASPYR